MPKSIITKRVTMNETQWDWLLRHALVCGYTKIEKGLREAETIAVTEHTDTWLADAAKEGVTPDCPCGSEGFCLGHRDDCPY